MQKIYSRINWENFPSEKTAVNESNLNKMDLAIDNLDDRVVAMDASKVDLTRANELVEEILWDESNGTLTVVKMNGARAVIDTKLEKLAVNFTYDPQTQQLVITLDDGTVQNVDLSSLITEYEFLDSDTIAFEIVDGKVKAIVKNGSITEDHLSPDYLGEIRTQVGRAEMSAKSADASEKSAVSSSALAKSYAVGGTGTRDGEDTDNARYYMEQAKAVSAVDIATTEKAGIVKPDGTTITIDEDGTLHGVAKITVDNALSSTSTNPVQNKVVTSNLTDIRKETTVNLLKPTLETHTDYGITCTANGDGTYTLNGTPSIPGEHFGWRLVQNFQKNIYGGCLFTGAPLTADVYRLYVGYFDDNGTWKAEKFVGSEGIVIDGSYPRISFEIVLDKGASPANNLLFKPMLTTNLNATYDDFVPYTGDIGRLNGDVAELNKTVDTLKKSVSDGKTKVANAITDKGVETATDATFDVMAENISKIETGGGELHGATLAVSTEESTLFGQTVTLTLNGASIGTTVFADNGTCSFVVQNPGTYTITCGEAHNDVTVTGDNVVNKTVISVELSLLKIVTFADGTDAEIAKMIEAHYNDKINIADYWAVGDTRSVSLSAMSATGVGESHRAQTVQFVIGDFEHDDLATPINGHTKAAVTLLQKDCLMDATSASNVNNGSADTEKGYMNSTNTNVGGWKNCARRTWCNNVFFSALPSTWQSMVKIVNKKSGTGGGSSSGTEITADKIFIAAEIEIFGSRTYSVDGEGTQYQYYKNATANRYKMPKWDSSSVSHGYWERSPYSGNKYAFCDVGGDGNSYNYYAGAKYGVAPCLCI